MLNRVFYRGFRGCTPDQKHFVIQNAYLAKPMGVKMSIGFRAGEYLRQTERTGKKEGAKGTGRNGGRKLL